MSRKHAKLTPKQTVASVFGIATMIPAIVLLSYYWGGHEFADTTYYTLGARLMCHLSPSETGAEYIAFSPNRRQQNSSAYLYDKEPPRGIIKHEFNRSISKDKSKEAEFSLTMYNGTNYTFKVSVEPAAALYYKNSSSASKAQVEHEAGTSYEVNFSANATVRDAVVVLKTSNGQKIKSGFLNVTTTREDWDINPARAISTVCQYKSYVWKISDLEMEGDDLYLVGIPEVSDSSYTLSCNYYKSFVQTFSPTCFS